VGAELLSEHLVQGRARSGRRRDGEALSPDLFELVAGGDQRGRVDVVQILEVPVDAVEPVLLDDLIHARDHLADLRAVREMYAPIVLSTYGENDLLPFGVGCL